MPTNFPTSLDNLVSPASGNVLDAPGLRHSDQHINSNDAVNAIETKVGINFSSTQNSIDYIVRLFLLVSTEHQSAGYREIEGFPFPETVTWYTDNTKTIKLVEKEYVYSSSTIVPEQVILRLFNGTVANTTLRTITDTIFYDGVFEISRQRSVIG
jgi:hypothetical protein